MEDKFIEITSDIIAAGTPAAISSLLGISIGHLSGAALSSIVKQGAQACMNKVHNDVKARQLSSMQINRVEQVLHHAQIAYYEMIEKQGWELSHPESDAYISAHIEACEHTVINAINESQSKKIPFEGYLFASQYHSQNNDLDNFHMMANLLFKMTWREVVLVNIIYNDWLGVEKDQYITNHAACVEVYDLVTWGLVKPNEGWVIENNCKPVHLSEISITEFGSMLSKSLLLEKITDQEKTNVIGSLQLSRLERPERVNKEHGLQWETIRGNDVEN